MKRIDDSIKIYEKYLNKRDEIERKYKSLSGESQQSLGEVYGAMQQIFAAGKAAYDKVKAISPEDIALFETPEGQKNQELVSRIEEILGGFENAVAGLKKALQGMLTAIKLEIAYLKYVKAVDSLEKSGIMDEIGNAEKDSEAEINAI